MDAYRTPTGRLPEGGRQCLASLPTAKLEEKNPRYRIREISAAKKGKKKPFAIASGNLKKPGRKKNGARLARRASRNFFSLFSCFLLFFKMKIAKKTKFSFFEKLKFLSIFQKSLKCLILNQIIPKLAQMNPE